MYFRAQKPWQTQLGSNPVSAACELRECGQCVHFTEPRFSHLCRGATDRAPFSGCLQDPVQ